jgi:hypothetical protein
MMKKKLMPLALVFVSLSGVAGEYSVTMADTPNLITIPGGTGLSVYTVRSTDIQSRTLAKVVSIDWNTTGYPQSIGENVEICFRVLGGRTICEPIAPNSSGTVYSFAGQSFYPGAGVNIRHTTQVGGARNSRPSGQDMVRFNLRY